MDPVAVRAAPLEPDPDPLEPDPPDVAALDAAAASSWCASVVKALAAAASACMRSPIDATQVVS